MIDRYVDWVEYWNQEIAPILSHLEDFEPTLIDIDYDGVRSFVESVDAEIYTDDCEIRSDGRVLIMWTIGYDEEAVSLTFMISDEDIILEVEYR